MYLYQRMSIGWPSVPQVGVVVNSEEKFKYPYVNSRLGYEPKPYDELNPDNVNIMQFMAEGFIKKRKEDPKKYFDLILYLAYYLRPIKKLEDLANGSENIWYVSEEETSLKEEVHKLKEFYPSESWIKNYIDHYFNEIVPLSSTQGVIKSLNRLWDREKNNLEKFLSDVRAEVWKGENEDATETPISQSSYRSDSETFSLSQDPSQFANLDVPGSSRRQSSYRSDADTFFPKEEDCCKEKTDEIDEKINDVKKRIKEMHSQLDEEFKFTQNKFGQVLLGGSGEIGRAQTVTP